MSLAASKFDPNVSGSSEQVAVVLCCTAGDAQVVTALAQALRSTGSAEPQVVMLEGDSFGELSDLAMRQAGSTVLYVLCRGADMSVAAIQQVRSVLRGHSGGQFMTVQVSSVDRMEAALAAALSGPRFSSPAGAAAPATIRGVPAANSRPVRRGGALPGPRGMMTNPPAPPRAPSRAPRTLMGAAPAHQGAPTPGLGDQGPGTMMGVAVPPEGPAPMGYADQGPSTMMGAAPPPEGNPLQPQGPSTMMGVAVPPEGPAPDGDLVEPGIGSGWMGEEEEASISGSATMTFDVSEHHQAANSNPDADPQAWQQWLAQGQQAWAELWSPERRALKLGVAGGIVVLIPAIALLLFFGLDDSKEEASEVQAFAAQSDYPKSPAPTPTPEASPSLQEPAPPESEPAKPAAPAPAKSKAAGAEPAAPEESEETKYREFLRVEAALRRSSIRGLDSLIIDTSKSRKFTFRSARRYCNRKEAGKLSGWRLPTGRELSRVAGANLTGRGSFWAQPSSRSKSRRAFVWDGKRKKLVKKSAKFRGARALCVRDRVSTASGR